MKVRTARLLAPIAALAATLLPHAPGTAGAAATAGAAGAPAAAPTGPLGTTIPSWCTAHTSFSGGADAANDYRCAGMAIEYHTGGVAFSPFPIWAGQWLFTDATGQYRVGYCTLNRGNHPTVAVPSHVVSQAFPKDPGAARTAYLAWRYGDTRDPLTAAALWAVFHYYAQDAAGTNRASSGTAPLVPRLDGLQADSGRADLQAKAIALDAEAAALSGGWNLAVTLGPPSPAGLTATFTLLAGSTPVPGREVIVHVSGSDESLAATTGTDGTATVTMPGPLSAGTVTVVGTVAAPGPAVVYRGTPATPDPQGAQYLVTAGAPQTLRAEATADVPAPATTTTAAPTTTAATTTTTAPAPPTTAPPTTIGTTTTEAAASTTPAPTTELPSTTAQPVTTLAPTTTAAITTTTAQQLAPTTSAASPPALPRTGGGGDDGGVAYIGTALLVAGIGLIGTVRRRAAE